MNSEINSPAENETARSATPDSAEVAELRNRIALLEAQLQSSRDRGEALKKQLAGQTAVLAESHQALQRNAEALDAFAQRLRGREATLDSIFNAAVEGIVTIDSGGKIIAANASVKAILGYSEAELVGRHIGILMRREQADHHNAYIRSYLENRQARVIGRVREVEGRHKTGRLIPIDLSLAEFTIDGELFFTGILRDISQRKIQERENREHLEELAHVTRLGLMGEMASGIAHEVNQPLTAIAAYTEVGLNLLKMPRLDPEKLAHVLTQAHEQALRAGQIIHRMRDFIRSKTVPRARVDVNHLIQDCLGLCTADIKLQNIELRTDLDADVPLVLINEVQIEQVLLNLIRNAIEALGELPHAEPRRLAVCSRADRRGHIEISVEDNGPGIPAADHARIMMPFFTTKRTGMGMGLSISRSLVEAHHGILRFHSLPGSGCTFYMILPSKELVNAH